MLNAHGAPTALEAAQRLAFALALADRAARSAPRIEWHAPDPEWKQKTDASGRRNRSIGLTIAN